MGTTLAVIVVLAGLGRIEKIVSSHSMRSTITIHAKPGPSVLEDLETLVRRTGLDIVTVANRQENVDDLWHAAVNGHGQYFSAKNPTELVTALRTALSRVPLSDCGSVTTLKPAIFAPTAFVPWEV